MIDWTKAPAWAQWHTTDKYGAMWWAVEPEWSNAGFPGESKRWIDSVPGIYATRWLAIDHKSHRKSIKRRP